MKTVRALCDRESHTFEGVNQEKVSRTWFYQFVFDIFHRLYQRQGFYSDTTLQKPLTRVDLQGYIIITTRNRLCTFFENG